MRCCVTCLEDRKVVDLGLVVRCKDLDREVWDSVAVVGHIPSMAGSSHSEGRSADTCPVAVNTFLLELDRLNHQLKKFFD